MRSLLRVLRVVCALSLGASLVAGCAADAGSTAADNEATTVSPERALGLAVQAKWEASAADGMTELTRAKLEVDGKPLKNAVKAFDTFATEIADEFSDPPLVFTTKLAGQTVFIVYINGGDDRGEHLSAFNAADTLVAHASSPSSSEFLEWEITAAK